MADKVLDPCRISIEKAVQLSAGLHINTQQCKFLVKKLSETGDTLNKFQEVLIRNKEITTGSGSNVPDLIEAATELRRVLNSAGALIADCCCQDQFLMAAIKQGGMQETFAKIIYDVHFYMSVLCSCILLSSTSLESNVFDLAYCDGKLDIIDNIALSTAAKADKDSLKKLLMNVDPVICRGGEGCNHNTPGQCLAISLSSELLQVLSRESTSSGSSPPLLEVSMKEFPRVKDIGNGSFGRVVETCWRGEKFARKTFIDREYFEQERAALAGLNHPNIVRLVCCAKDEVEDAYGLVLELMHKDLFQLLKDWREEIGPVTGATPFSLTQAVDLMLQVAEGMKYIHSKGLAHRDVKSPNILIKILDSSTLTSSSSATIGDSRVYIAKVADFGLTRVKNSTARYSKQTPNMGTRAWKAPEVFPYDLGEEPERFHPKKTDVYSFGIVCSEILTGQEPWQTIKNLALRVRKGKRPALPENIPLRLQALIRRCWDGEPLLRPAFSEICRELRYIKALLLRDGTSILAHWIQATPFNDFKAQTQGPWGGNGGRPFHDGIVTSIRRIKLRHSPGYYYRCIWWLEVEYVLDGKSFIRTHGDVNFLGYGSVAEIEMKRPGEFLTQIEGSYGELNSVVPADYEEPIVAVTSLKFTTNMETFGPYGGESMNTFRSDGRRIMGFYGRSGRFLDQIGVFIVS